MKNGILLVVPKGIVFLLRSITLYYDRTGSVPVGKLWLVYVISVKNISAGPNLIRIINIFRTSVVYIGIGICNYTLLEIQFIIKLEIIWFINFLINLIIG